MGYKREGWDERQIYLRVPYSMVMSALLIIEKHGGAPSVDRCLDTCRKSTYTQKYFSITWKRNSGIYDKSDHKIW